MLSDFTSVGSDYRDFRKLGFLMVLMELGTSLTAPESFELQAPEKWKDQIKSFLHKTKDCSRETLQQV